MKLTALDRLSDQPVSHNPTIRKKVLLDREVLPHLTNFSQAEFPPGQTAPVHAHADMWEVFFVESGEGQITIDGQAYALTPGTCVVVEPGEMHEVANGGTVPLVLTYFGVCP